MKLTRLALPEVVLIEPRIFADQRGYFFEIYQEKRYAEYGVPHCFVQDNLSFSAKGVVRGLHYQLAHPQGKLVMVLAGEVYDVVVDIRRNSPRFGCWLATCLSAANHCQLYIPPGFAHGFAVVSDNALFLYKCTDFYHPGDEYGIIWNDPTLNIPWPVQDAILSPKDQQYPPLHQTPASHLPLWEDNRL